MNALAVLTSSMQQVARVGRLCVSSQQHRGSIVCVTSSSLTTPIESLRPLHDFGPTWMHQALAYPWPSEPAREQRTPASWRANDLRPFEVKTCQQNKFKIEYFEKCKFSAESQHLKNRSIIPPDIREHVVQLDRDHGRSIRSGPGAAERAARHPTRPFPG